MDLHQQLRDSITDKKSRDAALAFLRRTYSGATQNTCWEDVIAEAQRKQGWHEINWKDPLELYEVEGRPVGVAYPPQGNGHAWVWTGSWTYAPALAPKASIEGARSSPRVFLIEFPGADLVTLEATARAALGWEADDQRPLLTPPASEIPSRGLIEDGYALTKFIMSRRPAPFAEVAPKVVGGLGIPLLDALPFLEGWYNFASYELREPPGTDWPSQVQTTLRELATSATEKPSFERDHLNEFLWTLRKAVTKFALEKSRVLARKIRYRLRRAPPSGIFEGRDHRNLWDEYCLQVQHGPPQLESAWTASVEPLVDFVVEELPRREATLLTLAQRWEEDDFHNGLDSEEISPEGIRTLVLSALAELADERPQDWVTG